MSTTASSARPTAEGPRQEVVRKATFKLLAYCRASDWGGYDPYDALNSKLFKALPVLDRRLIRLGLTQILKRAPINVRSLLAVPKTQNAKALALFLSCFVKLSRLGWLENPQLICRMVELLEAHRSPNTPYWCWGYSFPWQTRTLLVPRGTPNLVCSTFVATALLDVYELNRDPNCLAMAKGAAEYLLKDLFWSSPDGAAGFSYPLPSMRQQIHNANFLAAALLARVSNLTGETKFMEPALKAARCSAGRQREDGSWAYGEMPKQGWVDNFHTGYNLCALRVLGYYTQTTEFEPRVRAGFEYYVRHFFREDGAPRYFHDRTYPIDSHCVAQSIITLTELRDLDAGSTALADRVVDWAMANLWDERGFFYYRAYSGWRIKTSYMRWVQAWMLLALVTHLEQGLAAAELPEPAGYGAKNSSGMLNW